MKYLFCNLKNNMSLHENIVYEKGLRSIPEYKNLVIIPSFPFLALYNKENYQLGSQDISSFKEETLTGEVTNVMLRDLNVSYVIVGHSERRRLKKEINIDFINKINNAQAAKLKVIYCIGETKKEHDENKTYDVLEKQISEVLNNVEVKDIIIAYEPIWAIGTGITPTIEDIQDKMEYIKDITNEKYDVDLKVLYGGSVNPDNIKEINKIKYLDGYLVGKASQSVENVEKMLEIIEKN